MLNLGILMCNRLSGYFYMELTDEQKKKIPKEIIDVIKYMISAQMGRQESISKEWVRLEEKLNVTDIRYVELKGAIYSYDMYKSGARRSNDINFLTYEKDLD